MVRLRSNDGVIVDVKEEAALLSNMLKLVIEDCTSDCSPEKCIPVANVNGEVLRKIVVYMEKQKEFASKKPQEIMEKLPELRDDVAKAERELREWKRIVEVWEEEYMDVTMDMLYDLYLAANYMDIEGLLCLCTEKIASLIRGKSVKEMRKVFNIQNDFTPEEEAKHQEKHSWAFAE